jgi:hypothetical protein
VSNTPIVPCGFYTSLTLAYYPLLTRSIVANCAVRPHRDPQAAQRHPPRDTRMSLADLIGFEGTPDE